jgi:hypothetical protein
MTSLADKLKSMGVKLGAEDIPKPDPKTTPALDDTLAGHELETPQGRTYVAEVRYAMGHPHGRHSLELKAPLGVLGRWAGDERIGDFPAEAFAFLDTETTGLSGGAGTQAFLIGIGRFAEGEFQLAQFFLREPIEEPAQLAACEEFLAPCQAIVTFNGKSFDIPLLQSRFNFHGWKHPFADLAHIDLLHLARRLWRERLPSRTLISLEAQILDSARSEDDVPGWMAPALYFEYLRYGDPTPLKSIFYHNAMDVVSLSALLDHMGALLADPLNTGAQYSVDLIALAKLFEDMGDLDQATRLYLHALEHEEVQNGVLPLPLLLSAIQRLARIYKRAGDYPAAIELWEQAAEHAHLESHVELAKYYEHRNREYGKAIAWTQAALDLVQDPDTQTINGESFSRYEQLEWIEELEHRLNRLQKKFAKT